MKLFFDIGTPAHFHFFKNAISELKQKGHSIKIAARDYQSVIYLLDKYDIEHDKVRKMRSGILKKAIDLPSADYHLLKAAKDFHPDILVSLGSVYLAHVSRMIGKPHISFEDTEVSIEQNMIYMPFTEVIFTPQKYRSKINPKKHIRIKSYKELAYLHPNRYRPDPTILDTMGISRDEKYVLLRFNAFDASHDVNIKGFSIEDKKKLLAGLTKHAKVFISSENPLPPEFKRHALSLPPEKMHDALYYASLFVGDAQTTITESACLGTPAIRSNKWVGPNDMSNFIELEQDYKLIYNIKTPIKAIEKAVELIQRPELSQEWQRKREKLLSEKIDLTAFLVWFIENYPESKATMKGNPEYQDRFK